jgi:hypothetical protein
MRTRKLGDHRVVFRLLREKITSFAEYFLEEKKLFFEIEAIVYMANDR